MKAIVLFFCFVQLSTYGQETPEKKCFFYAGIGLVSPAVLNSVDDPRAYDQFALLRKSGILLNGGVGLEISPKWTCSIDFKVGLLTMEENRFETELETFYPESYVYNDFDTDNTGSSPETMRVSSFQFRTAYKIEREKVAFYPSVGLGIQYFSHRDYTYAIRHKSSNTPTILSAELNRRITPLASIEVAFNVRKWKYIYVFVGTEIGQLKANYTIETPPVAPPLAAFNYHTSKINYIPLQIGLRLGHN